MEDLGSKLRELRVKKGYTQEYVARKFNVTRQTISKWENNKTTPDIETLKKICEFYSTNINSILNEDNSKNKKNNLLVLTAIIFNIFVTILGLFELIQMNFFSFTHGIFTWFALSGLIVIDILNYFYIYYSYLKNEKFFYTMFFPLVIL
ncbi:helix-turn-helix domain-containing protein, partial [Enterococcus faecium]